VQFDAERRWYRRLRMGTGWEVWLLTWLPGQSTALHDHGPSSGAFTVLAGTLHETIMRETSASARRQSGESRPAAVPRPAQADAPRTWSTHAVTPGGIRAFDAGYVHDVANRGPEPAVSLHVYGPALTRMTRYRLAGDGQLIPTATEQAGADW
jgi:predicted metal-dependent enzyme (double-stranded beta helix superfamily)